MKGHSLLISIVITLFIIIWELFNNQTASEDEDEKEEDEDEVEKEERRISTFNQPTNKHCQRHNIPRVLSL